MTDERKHKEVKLEKPDHHKGSSPKKALNTALRLLAGRDHSRYELVVKLKRRGFGKDEIDAAIISCEQFDYINDERTARVYIRQLKRKGYGKKRIQIGLSKKGLKGARILDLLDKSLSETDEREGAERILKKHIKRFEREKDRLKRRDKIYRFLYSRGFSQEIIAKNLSRYDQTAISQSGPERR